MNIYEKSTFYWHIICGFLSLTTVFMMFERLGVILGVIRPQLRKIKLKYKGSRISFSTPFILFSVLMACRGRADKNTGLKLWCFWSAECGFESLCWHLCPKARQNHYCCILQIGHKAVGPVCCVMHLREPSALIVKRRGSAAYSATGPCKPWHGAIKE